MIGSAGAGGETIVLRAFRGDDVEAAVPGRAAIVSTSREPVASTVDVDGPLPVLACAHPMQVVAITGTELLPSTIRDEHLALAAGRMEGTGAQRETLLSLLATAGAGAQVLRCGPKGTESACAGMHALLVAYERTVSRTAAGCYADPGSKAATDLQTNFLRMTRLLKTELGESPDECGLPSPSLSLRRVALWYAGLADPSILPPDFRRAAGRLRTAICGHCEIYAPPGTMEGDLAQATGAELIVRRAENGLVAAVSLERGWGMALHSLDGRPDTAEIMFLALVDHLGLVPTGRARALLDSRLVRRNALGRRCGRFEVDLGPTF